MTDDKKIDDGGPAFPTGKEDADTFYSQEGGLTKREWFAGMAIAGHTNTRKHVDKKEFAKVAYELADAMIAEGKKGHE